MRARGPAKVKVSYQGPKFSSEGSHNGIRVL